MESLRWRRLEPPGGPGTERVRPVVRRRTGPTRSRDRTRLAVVAGGAAVALAAGLFVAGGHGPGAGSRASTSELADGSLAALAPDVAGRPWLARRGDGAWVWGRAGHRRRNLLPEDESGLAISERWLASGVSTPAVTRIRVRDVETGSVVREEQLDFRAAAAAFAGNQLLVTGYRGGIAGEDGGLVAIGVPGGPLRTLVAGGPFPARLGAHPSKGDVQLSGDGSLAAVNTCGSLGCDNLVVDVAGLTTRIPRNGAPGYLRSVTADTLVLTDAAGAWIKGVDARSGRESWTIAGTSLMEPVSMADGGVIADLGRPDGGWQVAAIDGRGRVAPITDPVRAPGPWVWPAVSSPTVAVIGEAPFEAAIGAGDAAASLVRGSDLHTLGTLVVQPGE